MQVNQFFMISHINQPNPCPNRAIWSSGGKIAFHEAQKPPKLWFPEKKFWPDGRTNRPTPGPPFTDRHPLVCDGALAKITREGVSLEANFQSRKGTWGGGKRKIRSLGPGFQLTGRNDHPVRACGCTTPLSRPARIVFNDARKAFVEVLGAAGVSVDVCIVYPNAEDAQGTGKGGKTKTIALGHEYGHGLNISGPPLHNRIRAGLLPARRPLAQPAPEPPRLPVPALSLALFPALHLRGRPRPHARHTWSYGVAAEESGAAADAAGGFFSGSWVRTRRRTGTDSPPQAPQQRTPPLHDRRRALLPAASPGVPLPDPRQNLRVLQSPLRIPPASFTAPASPRTPSPSPARRTWS
ncbi:hypothetical protein FB451DRAFT_1167477 [Mycena latifolia]|nr:hypothetical protein FB451DRAFT_1167477 [Mycena latifolia]